MHLGQIYINGAWRPAQSVGQQDIINPATGAAIGSVALSGSADADLAISQQSKPLIAGLLRRQPSVKRCCYVLWLPMSRAGRILPRP
jgi:acyl-CoA reductase-like NAD-dependent aldehyde dehydrogenase